MSLAAEVVTISLVVTTVGNQEYWQIRYSGRHTLTNFFCILGFNGMDTFPIAIIKAPNQKILFRESNEVKSDLKTSNLEPPQKPSTSNKDYFYSNISSNNLISKNIRKTATKNCNSDSDKSHANLEEAIKEIYKRIQEVQSIESSEKMNWQKKISGYEEMVTDYYRLVTKSDLANSALDVERIQEILQRAEDDEILSLLLNEVDNLIVQTSSFNTELHDQNENYQKWAEIFRVHVDSCDQLNPEVSRLMTKISSLLEQLQDFRSSEAFDTSLESSQSINTKVQSLELLMEEAEVEKERRKIKRCFNTNEWLKNFLSALVHLKGGNED